jgi:hypothetical protein
MAISGGVQGLIFSGANFFLNKLTPKNYIDIFSFTASSYSLNGTVETTDYKTITGDTYNNFILNKPRTFSINGVIFKNLINGENNKNKYDYGLTALLIEGLRARQKLAPLLIKSLQFSGLAILKDYSIDNYGEQVINLSFEEKFIFLPFKTVAINGVPATQKPSLVKVIGV